MGKQKYTEEIVLKRIRGKRTIKVTSSGKLKYVHWLKTTGLGQQTVGNSTLGMIDYLTKVEGYVLITYLDTKDGKIDFKRQR